MRSWISRVLLFSIVLRALIPTGYMPDMGALQAGTFKVVICTALGTKTITLDQDGSPLPDRGTSHHGEPCVFGALAQINSNFPEPAAVPAPDYGVVVSIETTEARRPPVRAGPILGSRGPPLLS